MEQKELQDAVQVVLDHIKRTSFVKDYTATNEEAMGLLVSKFFEWDGVAILKSASYALEDANFHTESAVIDELVNKLK